MSYPEIKTEQQVIAKFQELRQGVNVLWNKVNDLESEAQEHELVIKALEPMDPQRKCFRLVGDVLVERTVAETLPAVLRNKEGLEKVVQSLNSQLEQKKTELSAFQAEYKIRVKGQDDEASDSTDKPTQPGSSAQGVLVSKG